MKEIRANTASEPAFRKRFFRWFDGFQVMKFLHHARDHFYGTGVVATEAEKLLEATAMDALKDDARSTRRLLEIFRRIDRGDGAG